jgi:hypothetical protein
MHDFARQDTEDQQRQRGADQEGGKGGARGRRLRSDGRPQDDRHGRAHGHLRAGLGILRSDDALGRAGVGQSQLRTGEGGPRIRRAETPEIGNDDETGWGVSADVLPGAVGVPPDVLLVVLLGLLPLLLGLLVVLLGPLPVLPGVLPGAGTGT